MKLLYVLLLSCIINSVFSMEINNQNDVERLEFIGDESKILDLLEKIMTDGLSVRRIQGSDMEKMRADEKLEYLIEAQLNPDAIQRMLRIFTLLKSNLRTPFFIEDNDFVVPQESLRELDVLIGSQADKRDHSIAQHLKRTKLHIGYITLCRHLMQIKKIQNLEKLQEQVRILSEDASNRRLISDLLAEIAPTEDAFLSFWVGSERGMRDFLVDYLDHQAFQHLYCLNESANSNSVVIEFKQLYDFASPLIGPGLSVGSLCVGIATLNPVMAVSGGFFTLTTALQMPQNIQTFRYSVMALYLMQKKLIAVASFTEKLEKIRACLIGHGFPQELTDALTLPHDKIRLNELQELLKTGTFHGTASFFSHWGRISTAYRAMVAMKNEFINAYLALGTADFILSLAELLENGSPSQTYCLSEYNDELDIEITNGRSILVAGAHVVTNNIRIGNEEGSPFMVITGPNARGKTTILRMVGAAALMASTIGIAPASAIRIPCSLNILTSINIADNPAKKLSLYQAASKRLASILVTLSHDPARPCLVILDEPLVGTDPVLASATASEFLLLFGAQANVMGLVTSHLKGIAALASEHDTIFTNYHMAAGYQLVQGFDDNVEAYTNVALDIVGQYVPNNSFVQNVRERLMAHGALFNRAPSNS